VCKAKSIVRVECQKHSHVACQYENSLEESAAARKL
jgi:hypothetical protein